MLFPIRNKTSAQILHAVAIVAAFAVPVISLIFAMRQATSHVTERLDYIARGTVVRAERMFGAVVDSLNSVDVWSKEAALSQEEIIQTLRTQAFENQYLKSISIWDESNQWTTKTNPNPLERENLVDLSALPKPAIGEIGVVQLDGHGKRNAVYVVKTLPSGRVAFGELHPEMLRDFFEVHAPGQDLRLSLYFEDRLLFHEVVVPHTTDAAVENGGEVNLIVSEAVSSGLPLRAVSAASPTAVFDKWKTSAPEYAAVGIAVAALMTAMVLRVARRSQSLEADLREAVRFREIGVHYQPVIDVNSGRCVGCEALMRLVHPNRGPIAAGEFIDLAEKTGLILPMSDILFERVVDDLGSLLAENRNMFVGVNLSPQHFASKALVKSLQKTFGNHIAGDQLMFEITERGLVGDKDTTARTIMEYLIARGGKLAVDDFGTGYSRLNCLQHFPLDYLKIDKAFVDGISSATASSGLVDQVIRIAEKLGFDLIAEGVEHSYQADYLRSRGVNLLQGWHFAKPMPAAEFIAFVERQNAD